MNRLLPLLSLALVLRLTAAEAPAPASPAPVTAPAAAIVTNVPAASPRTNAPATNAPVVAPAPDTGTNAPSKEGLSNALIDPEARELKPHDFMRFQIEEDPPLPAGSELNRVGVSVGGEALFPVSRHGDTYVKLSVAGRKLVDIRKDLKALLDAEYYNDCTVRLDLEGISPPSTDPGSAQKVTFYGAITQMMQISDGETLMLSEAVLRVGLAQNGSFANLDKVRIHRLDPVTKREITMTVNVNNILKKGARDQDKQLLNGDRIEVQDKTFNIF